MEVKKTILFFSRCELVHLYGALHEKMIANFEIVHIAYSDIEANILRSNYGIKDVIIFKNEYTFQIENADINEDFLREIDTLFIKQTEGRFNLNASIQSDRTFKNLSYSEALLLTTGYYKVWNKIFSLQRVDFFVHEATSLMLNHMACVLCREQEGVYTTHIMVQGESDFNFIMVDNDNGFPTEMNSIYNALTNEEIKIEEKRINSFIEKFRSSYEVFFDMKGTSKPNLKLYMKLVLGALKENVIKFLSFKKLNKLNDNIEVFLLNEKQNSKRLKNCFDYRKINYDTYDKEVDFYFFPLHLEPEAVVLYWAEGIYSNQVKLIENIASQLPIGVFLYVKDHPHLYGYRNVSDYNRIQEIPNVKLLPPNLPGKLIIKDSKGVITLNGTAGLEGLLLNKQVITFGSAFYRASERIKHVRDIRDFRKVIYDLREVKFDDDIELSKFVLAYLKSQKNGFTNFYGNLANNLRLDMDQNVINIASDLTLFFNSYRNL